MLTRGLLYCPARMCGIVGCTLPEECPSEAFGRMVDAMERRGPDGRGEWRDEFVAIGHRRLAVIDPTPCGAQPMASGDGNVLVAFNGEIYNHRELRALLPDARWRSASDTETILRLYEREGLAFVERLNGMFAIAIHDRRAGKLFLFRDRLGIKPLHVYWDGTRLMFASDLRALRAHPRFDRTLDQAAVRDYFIFNYVPAPKTIFAKATKLRPGAMLEFRYESRRISVRKWWRASDHLRDPRDVDRAGIDERAEELRALLLDAVRMQTLSDVPLGCFLSGGVDSTAVAWALSQTTPHPRTFCIGFREEAFDESPHARLTARALGTEHRTETLEARDCIGLVEGIGGMLGEPFADASLLPTLLLSRVARQHVTVALSGDGGDELFGGYDRYRWFRNAMAAERFVPDGDDELFGGYDRYRWIRNAMAVGRFVPDGLRRGVLAMAAMLPHYRVRTAAQALAWKGRRDAYGQFLAGWNSPWVRTLFGVDKFDFSKHSFHKAGKPARNLEPVERASYSDLVQYMPDDLLAKVDIASMHHSLEVRLPLLDHRIVEFALGLPPEMKIRGDETKVVLRRALRNEVPGDVLARPKAGFAVPLRHWLRKELRPLAEELLRPESLPRFDDKWPNIQPNVVRATWKRHLGGRWNHERQLWALMVFVLWHREVFGR